MKNIITVKTVVITLGLALFSGCGSDDSSEQTTPPLSSDVVLEKSAISKALESGSVADTSAIDIIHEARAELQSIKEGEKLLNLLYGSDAISYKPSNNSQIINIEGDVHQIFSILNGNKGNRLGVAGVKSKGHFALYGSNPFEYFQEGENLSYETPMKRLLLWLIGGEPLQESIAEQKRVIALSYVDAQSKTKEWLANNYKEWSLKECNDVATHATCVGDADLIIEGMHAGDDDAATIKEDLESSLERGAGVLYLHPNWGENGVSDMIESLFLISFSYGGNWWADDGASWSSVTSMHMAEYEVKYAALDKMLQHFEAEDYKFDWSRCKNSEGEYSQNYDRCEEVVGLKSEFEDGALLVKDMMNALDRKKENIFVTDSYKLQKLLALLGDKFREDVHYPMDKVKSDPMAFMRSYYSDHAVYNFRLLNPTQRDMGNFSRSDFSHITPTAKVVTLTSKKPFRATGLYALPGQTLTVERRDSSDVVVKLFINTLRSGATHQYERDGYKRPKYLKTPSIELKPAERISLTSPYGGVIELEFDSNDVNVSVAFENVGEHAFWAGESYNDSFSAKLNANEYDWAELVTSGFEVHSKLDKMIASINGGADVDWGSAAALAAATVKYTSNYPLVLAGYKGDGVDSVAEIHNFAKDHNLTIEQVAAVKHMNADQASCGYGCSGNPYDAYWAYSPIGHGDIHEIGHGLEVSRLLFEGFEGHARTNPYSYYTKSHYFKDTGDEPSCQNLPFKELYEALDASYNETNATAYLQEHLWKNSNWSHQVLLTIEAMMHAQKMGTLENGWHLLARVHILEREIKRAESDWEASRANLGFDSYSLDEFKAIRNNDWLVISYSFAAGLDFREYFTMMGIEYTQKAADQIASFGYESVPQKFFVSTPNGYCKSDDYGSFLDKEMINVDGNTSFPY